MAKVARITISVEEPLLKQFEAYVAAHGYPTRSEAVQGLMRGALVEEEWRKGKDVAGTLSLVYDHHQRGISEKMVSAQHEFGGLIVCAQHVHLDHHNCLEVIVARGQAGALRDLLARLQTIKGMKHIALMMATTGRRVG